MPVITFPASFMPGPGCARPSTPSRSMCGPVKARRHAARSVTSRPAATGRNPNRSPQVYPGLGPHRRPRIISSYRSDNYSDAGGRGELARPLLRHARLRGVVGIRVTLCWRGPDVEDEQHLEGEGRLQIQLQRRRRRLRHPSRQMRERTVGLLDDVGRFASETMTSDNRYTLSMTRMEGVVDRDFRGVLMGSMLLPRL